MTLPRTTSRATYAWRNKPSRHHSTGQTLRTQHGQRSTDARPSTGAAGDEADKWWDAR
jgi:hypothetical protein